MNLTVHNQSGNIMASTFEKLRTNQPSYPFNHYNTSHNNQVDITERDKESWSSTAMKCIGAVALFGACHGVGALCTDLAHGIHEGKARVAHDQASLHSIYEYDGSTEAFQGHATVVLTGLGTKDASETATSLRVHRGVGSVYAVEYSNKDLNTQDIAHSIASRARQDGITHVSFDGYSMGGPIALDIAAQLQQDEDDLEVVSVVLNSSPIGSGALTERSASSVRAMEGVLSLHPDLVYYENGRIAIELMARSEHYLRETGRAPVPGFRVNGLSEYAFNGRTYKVDYASLRRELHGIKQKMSQPNVADANLISNQANVLKGDLSSKIEQLDDKTVVVYTRSKYEGNDTVVDVRTSEHNVVEMLTELEQPHKVLYEDIQHANPVERAREYERMIRADIQPDVIYLLKAKEDGGYAAELLETLTD